jgi:hypothetical protein
MDNGRWTMDDGRWRMDDGQWTMDDGRWTMDDGRWTMDDGRWMMDDGRWTMDDGGPQLQLTTQQSNSAWETEEEDGGSNERQQIPQLIRRDYDCEKEEGLHLPCKSEGGMPRWPL